MSDCTVPLLQLFVRDERAREEGNVSGTVFRCREIELAKKLSFPTKNGAQVVVEDRAEEIVSENLGTRSLLHIEPLVSPLESPAGKSQRHSGALNLVKHLRRLRSASR